MCDVDITRLNNYREAVHISKLKACADLESFLMNPHISDREKLETLYITYEMYNEILTYLESRIESFTSQ